VPSSQLDHLVVTAASLEEGVEYVRGELGVAPQAGGEHVRMGTHNCLLKLGEKLFLEVIAPNPGAPRPDRPRWFQLDDPDSVKAPRLASWVARCDYIHALAPASLGKIETMTRGSFRWLITIPEDGKLPLQGIGPSLIEWRSETHPAQGLKDSGCSLVRFEGFHPQPETVTSMLRSIGFKGEFPVSRSGTPRLVAHVRTSAGPRRLS
jgi:glyoxalase-like protein